MMEVEFRACTLSRPSIGGLAGLAPTLIKTLSAPISKVSPSFVRTTSDLGPVKLASPSIRSRPSVASMRFSVLSLKLSTIACLRRRTLWMSTARAVVNAVVCRTPAYVGRLGAGDHRLGGGAALVDAGAANVLAFYDRRLFSGLGQGPGQRVSALAGPDHHGIVMLCLHRGRLLSEVVNPCFRAPCRGCRPRL